VLPGLLRLRSADANGFALYLIDVYGNRELLHRDLIYSCCNPIPIAKRPRPPELPELTADSRPAPRAEAPQAARDPDVPAATASGVAFCYLADVYEGLPGIARGEVKYLRIAQHVPWPLDPDRGMMPFMSGNAYQADCGYCDWAPVRVIGTVPVASDGSAYFQVPADVALYFQALDQRQMEIRRMRTMVSLKPGEVRGCRGCHESQAKAPVTAWRPSLALREPPCAPVPPPWGADKLLGYTWLVQPILDQHCVRCHGREEPQGRLDFTATVAADGLAQSYRTMFGLLPQPAPPGRKLVAVADRFGNAAVSQPKQFGSHRSPLVQVLLQDDLHKKEVRLSEVEWLSLVTWVDANAPYFDAFINKRPANGKPRRFAPLPNPLPGVPGRGSYSSAGPQSGSAVN
jgi:cytochrome c553